MCVTDNKDGHDRMSHGASTTRSESECPRLACISGDLRSPRGVGCGERVILARNLSPLSCAMVATPSEPVQPEPVQQPSAQPLSLRALLASKPFDPCVIFKGEHYWRDRSLWLKERGYMLRPRYSPDWKPSWVGTNKDRMDCEDSRSIPGVCITAFHIYNVCVVDCQVTARSCSRCDAHFRRICRCTEENLAKSASLRGRDWPTSVIRASSSV